MATMKTAGRPLNQTSRAAKEVVGQFVSEYGKEGFTIKDIEEASHLPRTTISNHVSLLVRRGELYRAESKLEGANGRPFTIFRTID